MATVTITIPEADVAAVTKAVKARSPSSPTAKAALITIVQRWVVEEQRRETTITPPELT
jgi:hypothetical protein